MQAPSSFITPVFTKEKASPSCIGPNHLGDRVLARRVHGHCKGCFTSHRPRCGLAPPCLTPNYCEVGGLSMLMVERFSPLSRSLLSLPAVRLYITRDHKGIKR